MIKIGGTEIVDIAIGSTPIEKAYIGSQLVWEKGGDPLPVSDGLIIWLDGKDLTSSPTYWYTSSKLACIYSSFYIQFRTTNNTFVAGSHFEITGNEGGCTTYTGTNKKISANPFYIAGLGNTSSMTIEAVINKTNSSNIIISGGCYYGSSAVGKYRYQYLVSGGHLALMWHNGSSWNTYTGDATLDANTPYHVVFQKDGDYVRFYINGVLDKEISASSYRIPSVENCGLIGFGRYDRLNNTTGQTGPSKYYSLAIYNRALSLSEIQQNYQNYFLRYNL